MPEGLTYSVLPRVDHHLIPAIHLSQQKDPVLEMFFAAPVVRGASRPELTCLHLYEARTLEVEL